MNEIRVPFSNSVNTPPRLPLFVEVNLCIFAAPTFAIELNSKVMKAYLVNYATTLYNGPIQVCPNDVLSEISNQFGKWSGSTNMVSEATYGLKCGSLGCHQFIFIDMVLINLK